MIRSYRYLSYIVFLPLALEVVSPCFALDLEAGLWNHIPLGSNFAGVAYAYTESDIGLDPTLLLEDVEMELDTFGAKYIHAFEVWDKSARVDVTQAYQTGKWKGLVDGEPSAIERSGWSDTFVRFTINLHGAPPLRGKEFSAYRAKAKNETLVGAGLAVRLPTGNYMDDKLINLGQNRFAFRPQVGVVHTRDKWTIEGTVEVAVYTDNNDFFNGQKLEQDPLLFTQVHLIRRLRPGESINLSLGYNYGGEKTVDGVNKNDRNQNTGWALKYAYPLSSQSGINIAYISSRTHETTGSDIETLALAMVFAW
jgi:hypothetical protein